MTESHYDIFVSYAKEDADFARRLVEALKARKISVWYDHGVLRLGDSFLRAIEDGLEHSDFFALLLSPDYFKKPWMQFETGVALGRRGKKRIFPILLKHVDRTELQRVAPSVADAATLSADILSAEEIADAIVEAMKSGDEGNNDRQEAVP